MKLTINFENNEEEQDAYSEIDVLARTLVAGARVSLIAAGATEEDINNILNEVTYSAVSSDEGATIEMGLNLNKIFTLMDDMDLDMDKLKAFGKFLEG